jgi:hypothetical protein
MGRQSPVCLSNTLLSGCCSMLNVTRPAVPSFQSLAHLLKRRRRQVLEIMSTLTTKQRHIENQQCALPEHNTVP